MAKILVDRQQMHVACFEIGSDVGRIKIGGGHHDLRARPWLSFRP